MAHDPLQEAREELDKEFRQFREHWGTVLEAVDAVNQAGPMDDVHGLLDRLEEAVEKSRTGGLLGGGAKGHRKARERYQELLAKKG